VSPAINRTAIAAPHAKQQGAVSPSSLYVIEPSSCPTEYINDLEAVVLIGSNRYMDIHGSNESEERILQESNEDSFPLKTYSANNLPFGEHGNG
jgi:hypothetical protein